MEPPPERSKRLHNFPLPNLRWGQQKFLRCVNLQSNSQHRSSPSPSPSPSPSSDHAANRSVPVARVSRGGGGARNGEVVVAARPWNMRTRRAACSDNGDESTTKIFGNEIGMKRGVDDDDGLKFSVSLLKEEIEEDFSIIFGKKLPRRPKKRSKIVQKKLNTIFPGLWLTEEVTIDSYIVPEA
ncbi:hypothetical protein V5N11_015937 [Cardamine amara subsp. amara]|uniref:DUF1639 family protein n=1 Tax=Cardamine amara subsp. amara TaxID=228776 RepID=A0ABD1A3X9_CARAN